MGSSHSHHDSSNNISPAALHVVNSLHGTSPGAQKPKPVKRPLTTSIGSIYDPFYLFTLISGTVYLLCPALAFIKPLTDLLLPPNYDPTVLAGFRTMMTMIAPISIVYAFDIPNSIQFGPSSPTNPYSNMMILTIMWRFLFVGPFVSYNAGIGAYNILSLMFMLFVDILLPVLSLILTSYDVNINALKTVFTSETPKKAINRLFGILGIAGFLVAYGVQVYIYFNPSSVQVQTVILPMVALYYVYLYFVSKQTGEDFLNVALVVHIVLFVVILLTCRWGWDAWIVEILAAFQGSCLFLWICTLLWTHVIGKYSVLTWMSIISALVALMSCVWIQFKGGCFIDKCNGNL